MSRLTEIITSPLQDVRNRSLDEWCESAGLDALLAECEALEQLRRQSANLYERVRALFFLYAIHRFHLPRKPGIESRGLVPFSAHQNLLQRRFEEAIAICLDHQDTGGPSDALSSTLAAAYRGLAFQTLADQVRRSVRSVRGNQWMFRSGHPADYPLRIRPELLDRPAPVLHEATPVRMDLTHSGWSDIFFLGMDYPEGARVLNVSIDLAIHGGAASGRPKPPVECYLRIIDRPVIRLVSVDLEAAAELTDIHEIFDFARDYLGLLKAGVIAAGVIPPGMEGSAQPLAAVLEKLTGRPGYGFELVTHVNNIPKGSRLAVSTNLLACVIAACMRATGQTASLSGPLQESERRLVAARAILGEWLGGSGGGWQDSGGVWPGIKLIQGVCSGAGDIEEGVSRGRLLPDHTILSHQDVSPATRERLQSSLVLVHGGMAQDVGPILEMVTEKYLLRSAAEWQGRQKAIRTLDEILALLESGDIRGIGAATERNFLGPIQSIIPWASNFYTEALIRRVRHEFGASFWGFWMLGGMSGGGMGFIFDPERKAEAQARLQQIMSETKRTLEHGVPFAMEPVVYDFAINERGTWAELLTAADALLPDGYYHLMLPGLLRKDQRSLSESEQSDLRQFSNAARHNPAHAGLVNDLFDRLLPAAAKSASADEDALDSLLDRFGFDPAQHERIQADLRSGRIGLAQNRLPVATAIEDVTAGDVYDTCRGRFRALPQARCRSSGSRLGRGRLARRRRGQPLDQGRGRRQGPQPVLEGGRSPSHLPRGSPGQEPPRRPRVRRAGAAHHHHQLPDPRTHRPVPARRAELRIRGSALPLRGPGHRPAPGTHAARSPLRLGRSPAPDARRAGPEGAREPASGPDRLGRKDRRRQQLYRQCAIAVHSSGRPLVRGPQPLPQRHPAVAAR